MRDKLRDTLRLDSIYRLLSWDERIQIHLVLNNRASHISKRTESLLKYITKTRWKPPVMIYNAERELRCYDTETEQWMSVEDYAKEYEINIEI